MKLKSLVGYIFIFVIFLLFPINSPLTANETCNDSFIQSIVDNDDRKFEYHENRNDTGIFYSFDWDKNLKIIKIKRNENNYPIVRFSLLENSKIIPNKTAIKKFNSTDLSKLSDDQIKKIHRSKGLIKIELVNGEKIEIHSKPYKLNDFKLSDFKIISIQNINTAKGILEMSFDAKITNNRNDLIRSIDNSILDNQLHNICEDFKTLNTWPLMSVVFDEYKYDADVREGLKNKEKLITPVFQLTYDNGELRSMRTEKGVGYFRQSFDFKKFPFDTQKLVISISTGVSNFQSENSQDRSDYGSITFLTPEKGPFLSLKNFYKPEINKLRAWKIKDDGISIKSRTVYQDDYYDIYEKKITSRSQNFLDIEIIIKRNFQHYLFKIMIPVFLILSVAWYVLWIPTHKYEARLNTSIISLLALIAFNFVFQDDIPKLEYLTDLDWFILLSYVFCCIPVFSSIAFSKFISKNQKKVDKVNQFIKIWGGLLYCLITIQIFFYK